MYRVVFYMWENKQDEGFQNSKKIFAVIGERKKALAFSFFFLKKKVLLTQYPYKVVHKHTSELRLSLTFCSVYVN